MCCEVFFLSSKTDMDDWVGFPIFEINKITIFKINKASILAFEYCMLGFAESDL